MLDHIRGKLVVSCQAYEGDPLYDRTYPLMGRMAFAAQVGGAAGIRANTIWDIQNIREHCSLPIIGIIKKDYPESDVYITPTIDEIDALAASDCDMIATDATNRVRPTGQRLEEFFAECKRRYPHQLFMADCSTVEEGIRAAGLGFDAIATTLSGYTANTRNRVLPDLDMLGDLLLVVRVPVIVEGGLWEVDQVKEAFARGAWAVVIGSAITSPEKITRRFVQATRQGIAADSIV